jgi:hypothetical protein
LYRYISELAAMIAEGALGARGDFAVGLDGDVATAKETRGGGRGGRAKFTISTTTAAAGVAPRPLTRGSEVHDDDDLTARLAALAGVGAGVEVLSALCVCSSSEEGDVAVVVRLPCALPEGGRIACRARGRVVPVTVVEMRRHSLDGGGGGVTVGLYKLSSVIPNSLKPPGFNP